MTTKALKRKTARRTAKPAGPKYIVPHKMLMDLFGFNDMKKDKAVQAWRKWAPIQAELDAIDKANRDGTYKNSKSNSRRLYRLTIADTNAAETVLKAKATTISGIAAKLHVILVLSDGFDQDCITGMVRQTLVGMIHLIPHELRQKIIAPIVEMEKRAAA